MKNILKSLTGVTCLITSQGFAQQTTEIKITPAVPPTYYHQVALAPGFSNANGATVDLFAKGGKDIVSVPDNYVGSQGADKGDSYLGIITYYETGSLSLSKAVESGLTEFNSEDAVNYGEYIQIALPGALGAGKEYNITFKVSLADHSGFSSSGWGVYFSGDAMNEKSNKRLSVSPQVQFPGMVTNKTAWTELKAKYKATGTEKYAILGCFNTGFKTQKTDGGKGFAASKAYYYVSSVMLVEEAPDRDRDGVADKDDKCPDVMGLAALNGCPDADGDGIADADDKCPSVKGSVKLAGCPDADNDGVADADDKCPNMAGPLEFAGCPDTDKDGIPDDKDECPSQAGVASNFGCPEIKMDVKTKELFQKAMSGIQFESGKDVIKKSSFGILDNVASVLKSNPTWITEVQGHTDNVGNAAENKELSKKRAHAVTKYLKSKGVENKLTAEGFGMERPIADNKTAAGRAKNRRVEFRITYEQ